MAVEPYPPAGKKVTKTYRGGPWAKQKTTVRQLEDGSWWPSEIPLHRGDRYIGRYVVAELQQKTRTLQVLQWEEPSLEAIMRLVRM